MIDRSDPLWYKDAVVYQLHIKAYFDSNGDGIGDFAGLMQKLDYIRDLGVTALWLLPFYPSPLRDDGYDIADYRQVNPMYGRMRDFRRFVQAAHARDLRVITELVVNHTSDQHPWFQRARKAKPGSAARNFYVWNDDDDKFPETRIIFLDSETSNWAWDPVAKAYYWHRFYSHQPDLNFDNPRVLREVIRVLRFWLDMGVDGLRLDAVPYLCEREGTSNENLPETHAVLKEIRAAVDDHYPDRLLLGEANQWPEDTQEYFGNGDECHMAFHFPLMPRMYMAIAQEDRHPITDIMRQTPEIPDNCQWAIFLRNHDELTLEMVTDQERDYLWNFYAADRRMRINLGIRRRLAPLLENDRRKIELMNGLLLSMPGTPIIYYGDEIGMGDNIFLGDRDGVRTPMQWSPDRNAGFSRADPEQLYLPAIMDPIYGFDSVNVEAQQRSPSSLLNWMKRLIAVRQHHRAFGRGKLTFLYPGNRKVLAYLRSHGDETILCVVNLSRRAQAVELDLSQYRSHVPIELLGRNAFPPIGDLPYLLTLPAYSFYWFILAEEAQVPAWHEEIPEPMPEFVTLVMREGWRDLTRDKGVSELERSILPRYLPKQRWFAAKDETISATRLAGWAELAGTGESFLLTEIEVETTTSGSGGGQPAQRYALPLAVSWDGEPATSHSGLLPFTIAKARRMAKVGVIYDALAGSGFPRAVVAAMRQNLESEASDGRLLFRGSTGLDALPTESEAEVRRLTAEQSNTSVLIGDQAILKFYRRLSRGRHPELEISRFLTEMAGFGNTPAFLGSIEHIDGEGRETALAVLQALVQNQGDGWSFTVDYLERVLDEVRMLGDQAPAREDPLAEHAGFLGRIATLGRRTGELHQALAGPTEDPAFRSEPISARDMASWRASAKRQAQSAFGAVRRALRRLNPAQRATAEDLLARRKDCLARIEHLSARPIRADKSRVHGDYHLGQVLVAQEDFYILDFEGEPARSLEERRAKTSPLIDVAGMLRSFDYAAWAALHRIGAHGHELTATMLAEAARWREAASQTFLAAYGEAAAGAPTWPEDPQDRARVIALFMLQKAFYEITYEAANRPTWLEIPLLGSLRILEAANEGSEA